MSESLITYAAHGDVALLTLDDGKANALSHAMLDALAHHLDRAEREAGSVVIAGRPGKFCAGFDLATMMGGPDAVTGILTKGGDLFLRLYTFPLPLVAACTGHALAGGALLLLCCDVRIGTGGPFKIGLNEIQIGLPLPLLGRELARDRLAPSHLTEATLLAKIYDPEAACVAGYLDRVAPAGAVEASLEAAKAFDGLSRPALAATKRELRAATVATIRDGFEPDLAALTKLAPTA
ncbi:MAG: crotonase/enoyl-CoA hydratase family protein [Myxococcota bacterium]